MREVLSKNLTSIIKGERYVQKCLLILFYNFAPQNLQCTASLSCPSERQLGQTWVVIFFLVALASSTETIPVGTAIIP